MIVNFKSSESISKYCLMFAGGPEMTSSNCARMDCSDSIFVLGKIDME